MNSNRINTALAILPSLETSEPVHSPFARKLSIELPQATLSHNFDQNYREFKHFCEGNLIGEKNCITRNFPVESKPYNELEAGLSLHFKSCDLSSDEKFLNDFQKQHNLTETLLITRINIMWNHLNAMNDLLNAYTPKDRFYSKETLMELCQKLMQSCGIESSHEIYLKFGVDKSVCAEIDPDENEHKPIKNLRGCCY